MAIHKSNNQISKLYVGNKQIAKVYKGNTLIYNAEYVILNGATSNAGSPSIVVSDSGDTRNTGLGDGAWYLINNGASVAALANKVTFTGYSKLWFRVLENKAFTDASIGYRTDTKTWLNASGVVSATRVDLSPNQIGDFYINIPSGNTSGYIIIQQTSQGVGVMPSPLRISKIWLE